jgi:hypothetical protein
MLAAAVTTCPTPQCRNQIAIFCGAAVVVPYPRSSCIRLLCRWVCATRTHALQIGVAQIQRRDPLRHQFGIVDLVHNENPFCLTD